MQKIVGFVGTRVWGLCLVAPGIHAESVNPTVTSPVVLDCTPLVFKATTYFGNFPSFPSRVAGKLELDEKHDLRGTLKGALLQESAGGENIPFEIEVVGGNAKRFGNFAKQYWLSSVGNQLAFIIDLKHFNSSIIWLRDGEGKPVSSFLTNCAPTKLLTAYNAATQRIRDAKVSNREVPLEEVIPGYDVGCGSETAKVDLKTLCADRPRLMKKLLDQRSSDACMRSSFTNGPYGLMSGGLCWWHSTFQQQAWQLSTYSPEKPKPSPKELRELIARLYQGDEVVDFPGYHNWAEVTFVARGILLRIMMNRQLVDAVNPRSWGVWLMPHLSSPQLFRTGRQIEANYAKGVSTFIYYKIGNAYHAKVAYRVKRQGPRLVIDVVDSNWHGVNETRTERPAYQVGGNRLVIKENPDGTAERVDDDNSETTFPSEAWQVSHERFGSKTAAAWDKRCADAGY